MGIPQADTAHLEGSISPERRSLLWKSKRVFFSTPQTVVNDIKNGLCNPQEIVCLVIDEAHKATDNYAYTVAVRLISSSNEGGFRILALSATPGSDARDIQRLINNLHIAHVELRTEDDPDLKSFRHEKLLEVVHCSEGEGSGKIMIKKEIDEIIMAPLSVLNAHSIIDCRVPNNLNIFAVKDAER
jgi:ERCC4-related helicase